MYLLEICFFNALSLVWVAEIAQRAGPSAQTSVFLPGCHNQWAGESESGSSCLSLESITPATLHSGSLIKVSIRFRFPLPRLESRASHILPEYSKPWSYLQDIGTASPSCALREKGPGFCFVLSSELLLCGRYSPRTLLAWTTGA